MPLDVLDMPRRRAVREQIGAIRAVSRDGVDDRAGGARQPDRARPGLRIGKVDALALDPVPFEGGDLAEAAAGQHQQADDGDDMRAPELVAGEHGVEPGHLVRRQEPLHRLHQVAPGLRARVAVVAAVSPKLGHAHHHGQNRHGAVRDARPRAHGGEPVPDLLDRDGVHGQIAQGGQDVLANDPAVGFHGAGLPSVGLPGEEFLGEGGHRIPRRAGAAVLLCGFDVAGDQPAGLAPRLGDGHGIGAADVGVAPAHHAGEEVGTGLRLAGLPMRVRSPHRRVLRCSGLGGADAPGEGGFLGHGRGLPVRAARLSGNAGSSRGGVSSGKPRGQTEPFAP